MRKSIKQFAKILACVALPLPIVYLALVGLCYLGFEVRLWQERYVECHPAELLPYLEKGCSLEFPSDVKELKTAKTPVIEDVVDFLLKFATEPNAVNRFLESFPEGIAKEMLHETARSYKKEKDTRSSHVGGVPKWFRSPIQQGSIARYHGSHLRMTIYVDTTNEEVYVVYIDGFYVVN